MAEAKMIDSQTVEFKAPALEGVSCEVQHSVKSGKPVAREHGFIGVGVVTLPSGQPRVMLQVKHASGESLAGVMIGPDMLVLIECLMDAWEQARAISAAADSAVRQ